MATHPSVLAWRIPGTGEPGGLLSMGSHRVGHDWSGLAVSSESSCGFPYFLQFKPEFGNKLMIWATVCSRSCFCWLYRAYPSLATKNIISLILGSLAWLDHLVMSTCRVISCVVGRRYLLWPVNSLGKTLWAFVLSHFVLHAQPCPLLQVSLDFLHLHSSPLWWKGHLFGVLVLKDLIDHHTTIQLLQH